MQDGNMLSVIMQNVNMLSVIMQNIVMPSVVMPNTLAYNNSTVLITAVVSFIAEVQLNKKVRRLLDRNLLAERHLDNTDNQSTK
jgi:hypothetical protein